jgi:hypothetical protein
MWILVAGGRSLQGALNLWRFIFDLARAACNSFPQCKLLHLCALMMLLGGLCVSAQ